MLLIQILLAAFALFALLKTVSRFRAGDLSSGRLFGWTLFWLAVLIVAILPNTAAIFAKMVGVGRGADLVVYLALVLLFYLLFKTTIRLEKIERNLTKLTRQDAFQKIDKSNKNS